jgi:hypothetical protein
MRNRPILDPRAGLLGSMRSARSSDTVAPGRSPRLRCDLGLGDERLARGRHLAGATFGRSFGTGGGERRLDDGCRLPGGGTAGGTDTEGP